MINFRELRPGTIVLSAYVEFTPEANDAYREEDFGYADFSILRTTTAIMIQTGELEIDRIESGKAYVKFDIATLKKVVDRIVGHRAANRERSVA